MTLSQAEKYFFDNEARWLSEFWKNGTLTNKYSSVVNNYLVTEANMTLNKEQTRNLKNFSLGKEKDLKRKLEQSKATANTFEEFKTLGKGNFKQHTEWLKNEGLSVNTGAEQLRQWNTLVRNTDRYLQWITAEDEKVRPEHRELNGVIRKVSDPFWQSQFPGRDYNCRCSYKVLKTGVNSAIPKIPSPNTYGVEVNVGVNGLFFNENHTYLK